MSRLNLNLRPAMVGNQIRSNGELHGDDSVTAFYIPLHGIMLTKEEVNILAGDATWWLRHFNDPAGQPAEVLDEKDFSCVFSFKHKLKGARVRFVHSLADDEVTFVACKLAKIKLTPQTGGLTALSCEVQAVPTLDDRAAKLLGQLNHDVQIEIIAAELSAEDAQQDLPLNQHGEGEPQETPRDVTRIIDTTQEAENADTERQLAEALRGLEEKAA